MFLQLDSTLSAAEWPSDPITYLDSSGNSKSFSSNFFRMQLYLNPVAKHYTKATYVHWVFD